MSSDYSHAESRGGSAKRQNPNPWNADKEAGTVALFADDDILDDTLRNPSFLPTCGVSFQPLPATPTLEMVCDERFDLTFTPEYMGNSFAFNSGFAPGSGEWNAIPHDWDKDADARPNISYFDDRATGIAPEFDDDQWAFHTHNEIQTPSPAAVSFERPAPTMQNHSPPEWYVWEGVTSHFARDALEAETPACLPSPQYQELAFLCRAPLGPMCSYVETEMGGGLQHTDNPFMTASAFLIPSPLPPPSNDDSYPVIVSARGFVLPRRRNPALPFGRRTDKFWFPIQHPQVRWDELLSMLIRAMGKASSTEELAQEAWQRFGGAGRPAGGGFKEKTINQWLKTARPLLSKLVKLERGGFVDYVGPTSRSRLYWVPSFEKWKEPDQHQAANHGLISACAIQPGLPTEMTGLEKLHSSQAAMRCKN